MSKVTLISLPIGNPLDITLRVLEQLKKGGIFLCEDTRQFKKLLGILEIDTQLFELHSFHDHTQEEALKWVDRLEQGLDLFLVSDAGSPVISDPAYPLIHAALAAGHEIDSLPGVTSVITALELSGLPPHPFHFFGFLPREKGKRKNLFKELASVGGTQIFFEGPSRILDTCHILKEEFPEVSVAVVREITKKFQSVYRFMASDFDPEEILVKGEFVLLVHFENRNKVINSDLSELAEACLKKSSPKNISKLLASILDKNAKEVYQSLNSQK